MQWKITQTTYWDDIQYFFIKRRSETNFHLFGFDCFAANETFQRKVFYVSAFQPKFRGKFIGTLIYDDVKVNYFDWFASLIGTFYRFLFIGSIQWKLSELIVLKIFLLALWLHLRFYLFCYNFSSDTFTVTIK